MRSCGVKLSFKILLLCLVLITGCARNAYTVTEAGQNKNAALNQTVPPSASISKEDTKDQKNPQLVDAKKPLGIQNKNASTTSNVAKPADIVPESTAKANASVQTATTPTVDQRESDLPSKSGQEITSQPKTIYAINVGSEGVEIVANSKLTQYKSFRLTAPQRLVIDIFDVTTTIVGKVVPINKFGVKNARLGIYPNKVRIVLDALGQKFPEYKFQPSDKSLTVVLASINKIESSQVTFDEPAIRKVSQSFKDSRIDSIDFKVLNGVSRVLVKASDTVNIEKPSRTADGILVTVKNATLPERLQRPLETKGFETNVVKVTPYQVRTQRGYDTKILIRLVRDVPVDVKAEANTVRIDVKNPEMAESPAPGVQPMRPVLPLKTTSPAAKEVVSPQQIVGKKVYTGRRVTLEFADADIRKIFQLIAEVSNLNFLLGDDVTGTISIKLVNVPWDQALDVILETKGLGMKREGNIVVIRPIGKIQTLADEQQAEKRALEKTMDLKTKVFDVNFAAVSDIATQFNSLKSERGIIASDTRTNRVIVTDIDPAIEKMTALLKMLDIPEKQVLIEARIVEASSTLSRAIGIQWGLHTTDSTIVDVGGGGVLPAGEIGSTGTFGPGLATGITFGKLISGGTLDLKLSALATAEEIKIISSPKVVTLNNKAAKIAQGQSIPYQTTSAEGTKTEFVEAALTLEVTPHITSDGNVSMKIKATNNTAGSGSPPPINKKEATTELLMKTGETTVIGGIYIDNDTRSNEGVPFLKDIPLLGWLFKSDLSTKQKTELLIFITPRIIS